MKFTQIAYSYLSVCHGTSVSLPKFRFVPHFPKSRVQALSFLKELHPEYIFMLNS